MSKTAIVIGATGLIGAHLVKLLIESEHIRRIRVVTRRPESYSSEKIENHVIDFDFLSNYEHLFTGDILFSCLGTTLKQAGSIEAQRVIDLEYQYAAAQLAYQQGVNHYLLVSSSGADHTSASAYLKMKGELETKIQTLAFEHISILQPSLLLGERREPRFAEGIAAMILPLICRLPGLQRYRPIHARQVAQRMLELSVNPVEAFERVTLEHVFPNQSH